MANRTISTNQLTTGAKFAVDGVVNFSRIASKIEGEELERDQQRRRARGWIPVDKPYTTITISGAQVRYLNPSQKRPEEIYAEESLYTSAKNANAGFFFSGQNRGRALPWVGQRRDNTNDIDQIIPEGELANGLHVTLIMQVFQGKPNKGISLEGIIVNEPIRYYNFTQAGAGLDELGLTFHPASAEAIAAASAANNAPATAAPAEDYGAAEGYGYDANGDYGDNFSSQPVPQAQPQFQQPQQPQGSMPFGQNGGGIVYNPQGGNRNY